MNEEKTYLYTSTEWEDLLDYNGMTWISIDRFKKLQQENQSLKDRIEKAIEYIMQPNIEIREYHSCDMDYIYVDNELLEILKGDKE